MDHTNKNLILQVLGSYKHIIQEIRTLKNRSGWLNIKLDPNQFASWFGSIVVSINFLTILYITLSNREHVDHGNSFSKLQQH